MRDVSRLLRAAGSFACLSLATVASSNADARELRVVSGWATNYAFTEHILKPFMAEVEKATNGEITFVLSGPDTVATFEQFQPMQAGVFDVLFTHPSYHAGTTTLGMSIDATAADPAGRREAGVFDFIADHYRTNLQVELVGAPPIGSDGFRIFLKSPIEGEPGSTAGRFAAPPRTSRSSGSPVNMPGGEVYTSLQRGVIDGAIWTTTGVVEFKLNEVADYYSEPAFGQVGALIFFNGATWASLDDDQRTAITAAAKAIELQSVTVFDRLGADELAELQKLGMEKADFSEAEGAALDKYWAESVWEAASAQAAEPVAELRALAAKAGLAE
ncbi:TRAP transporter substrate-binding protein DctP [Aliihoeflea sp. 2WW]|uniref:TRAP transporter substrate-binding protein DctP n=1 Tax=Aliihoeflea sp. 2WW TaxID=1381123 RepID=UPI0009DE5A83|nr:TRAP transporter substrate-binding protein DctP [Aliihoeflea sp. 2WW]